MTIHAATHYYNDNNKHCAKWLQALIDVGLLPYGHVDDRNIKDVTQHDLSGFTQCHFFAGIGGWPLALGLAGWPATRPVWTASCPCQPFSAAGKRKGAGDERHLWPEFYRLYRECRPAVAFGEQVASKDGRVWLSGVQIDLEALGAAFGALDTCAAGLGAPHIRQRLYWVAYSALVAQREPGAEPPTFARQHTWDRPVGSCCGHRQASGWVADAFGLGRDGREGTRQLADDEAAHGRTAQRVADADDERRAGDGLLLRQWGPDEAAPEVVGGGACGGGMEHADGGAPQHRGAPTELREPEAAQPGEGDQRQRPGDAAWGAGEDGLGLGDAVGQGLEEREGVTGDAGSQRPPAQRAGGRVHPLWEGWQWLLCADGKQRRAPPGVPLLFAGSSAFVSGALSAAGNSISPPLAAEFILACEEARLGVTI